MKWLSISLLVIVYDYALAFSTHSRLATWALKKAPEVHNLAAYPPRKNRKGGRNGDAGEGDDFDPILDEPEGRRGDGRNWIEKSSPIGIGKLVEGATDVTTGSSEKETDGNYDLRVDGASFQTGPLSKRMFDTLMSVAMKRFPAGSDIPSELEDVYKIYAMDITAKEAVKAALDQNGLELAIEPSDNNQNEDEGLWGDIDMVELIDPVTGEVEEEGEDYDSFDTAVEEGDWEPGQPFTFIVRNVPARLKEMDISDLLSKLDPEGQLRDQAKEKGMTLPDEDVESLKALGKECDRRVKLAPYETQDDNAVYKGDGSKGYNVIQAGDLLVESGNADGTENDATLMHVMDSLVSHSCLVVDLTDGGAKFGDALKLFKMWDTSGNFFETIQTNDEMKENLPPMAPADGAGSPHAVAGFASYGDGSMQFLETRIVRDNEHKKRIVPEEAMTVLGDDGVKSIIDAFGIMCETGKNIARIAVAATNMEYGAFVAESGKVEETTDLPFISGLTFEDAEIAGIADVDDEGDFVVAAKLSSEAAALMVEELIDDGKVNVVNEAEGTISMSPHRICRYEGKKGGNVGNAAVEIAQETFGAHTDTSFLTMVPVAEISGLEIFDEDANKWLRPELLARQSWEDDRQRKGLDPTAQFDTVTIFEGDEEREVDIPWHCRYIVAMPGELLQIATRNEVAASVHRVVSVTDGDARVSAPVLLRPRSGMRMNLSKYFGDSDTFGSLLSECDGMKLEDIHKALQPSSYRN